MIPNPESNEIKKLKAIKEIDTSLSGKSSSPNIIAAQRDTETHEINALKSIADSCKNINGDISEMKEDIKELKDRPIAQEGSLNGGIFDIYTKKGIQLTADKVGNADIDVKIGAKTDSGVGVNDVKVAIGNFTSATGEESTAIGYSSEAKGEYSTAIGNYAKADGYASIAVGDDAKANGARSVALGSYVNANETYAVVIGCESQAFYSDGLALGSSASALSGVAISSHTTNMSYSSLPTESEINNLDAEAGTINDMITAYNIANSRKGTIATYDGIAIGKNTKSFGSDSISIGTNSVASNGGIAIGNVAAAYKYDAIAIGNQVYAQGVHSVSIGNNILSPSKHTFVEGINNVDYYSESKSSRYMHIIGNGDYPEGRDIFAVDRDGNVEITGTLKFTDGKQNVVSTLDDKIKEVADSSASSYIKSTITNPNILINSQFSQWKSVDDNYGMWNIDQDHSMVALTRGIIFNYSKDDVGKTLLESTYNVFDSSIWGSESHYGEVYTVTVSYWDQSTGQWKTGVGYINTMSKAGTYDSKTYVRFPLQVIDDDRKFFLRLEFGTGKMALSVTAEGDIPDGSSSSFHLAQVKLEIGSESTQFDVNPRDIVFLSMINDLKNQISETVGD